MNPIAIEIGKRLYNKLVENGYSQADLASYMGVTSGAVSSWINGQKVPRLDKVDKICGWLGCSRADILGEAFGPDPNEQRRNRLFAYYFDKLTVENQDKVFDIMKAFLLQQNAAIKEEIPVSETKINIDGETYRVKFEGPTAFPRRPKQ